MAIIALSAGCKKENLGDCFKSTGSLTTEMRELPPFNRLEVEDNVNVYIRFGETNKAAIEAGDNLLDLIETEVVENTLYIRNKNTCNWVRSYKVPVNIELHCQQLNELIARGFGEIQTLDTLHTDIFLAEQWLASGIIKLLLNTDQVYLKTHTGPADFECSGVTDYLYAYNSSQGIFHLEDIQANDGLIWNDGVGDIYVNVSDTLEMELDNKGDIYYFGDPAYVTIETSDDGQAIRRP